MGYSVFSCVLLYRNRRDVLLRMLVNTFLECYVSGGLRVLMKSSMMIQYLGLLWFWLDIHRYHTRYFSLLNPQIGLPIGFSRNIFAHGHGRPFDFDFFRLGFIFSAWRFQSQLLLSSGSFRNSSLTFLLMCACKKRTSTEELLLWVLQHFWYMQQIINLF